MHKKGWMNWMHDVLADSSFYLMLALEALEGRVCYFLNLNKIIVEFFFK